MMVFHFIFKLFLDCCPKTFKHSLYYVQVLKHAKSASQIPLVGPLFVPPVNVKAVAKAAVRAATDNAVPPGVLDVWGINRLGDR